MHTSMLRRTGAPLAVLLLAVLAPVVPRADAVNADHGDAVVSADPVGFTPHAMDGSVDAITQVGGKIVVGGTFTSVSPAGTFGDPSDDLVRNRIFAFDAATGEIDPAFDPDLGGPVNSLDSDGTHVYVGGAFGSVGGSTAIRRLVKLDATGAVVPEFRAVPDALVREVVVRGDRVYVGGAFSTIRSGATRTPRAAFAAVDAATGVPLPGVDVAFTGVYDPANDGGGRTNVIRFDVTADGTRLVAVGNFSSVGGLPRVQIAVLDTSGPVAGVAPWATNRFDRAHNQCSESFDTFMRDVDLAPDGSWFVVTTTGAYAGGTAARTMCDTTSRWETASAGNDPTWVDYTGGDTTYGVAVTGSAVYVGGHMRWQNNPFEGGEPGPGAVPREGIAALDPVNGLPLSWDPGRSRGVGAQALFATSQGLWVGSDTTRFGGETHGRIALLELAGGSTVPDTGPAVLPNDLFVAERVGLLGGLFGSRGRLLRLPVDAEGRPTGAPTPASTAMDWSRVRGGFLLDGTLYYGYRNGDLYKRTFDAGTGAVGVEQEVDLHDDPDDGERIPFALASATGMFYDPATHRLYYTVSGEDRLLYRYFTPESETVGAETFVADSGGISFARTAGMTLAGGRILYGSALDGALRSVPFMDGRVAGSPSVLSDDGTWRYRAILVPNG